MNISSSVNPQAFQSHYSQNIPLPFSSSTMERKKIHLKTKRQGIYFTYSTYSKDGKALRVEATGGVTRFEF